MQPQLQFMERFNVQNTTTITIYEKHSIYTMQLQLQFMKIILYTQCNYNYNSWKTFNIHNAITITIHQKHLIYKIQLQLQFVENI